MVQFSMDVQYASAFEGKQGIDVRRTFRKRMENRIRPRLDKLAVEAGEVSIYQKISPFWKTNQISNEWSITFSLINTHPAAEWLEAPEGTAPHLIAQEPHLIPRGQLTNWLAEGGSMGDIPSADKMPYVVSQVRKKLNERLIIIPHPGTEPDRPVQEAVEEFDGWLFGAAADAMDGWAASFGQEE